MSRDVPTQLLHATDIHNSIVQVFHQPRHVFVQKSLVHVYGITSQRAAPGRDMLSHKLQHLLLSLIKTYTG